MGRVTGGEVTYGRTVKTGDFENKRFEVKLSFGVDDGEDCVAILNGASGLAVTKAHEMLGLSSPAVAGKPASAQTRRTTSTPGPDETFGKSPATAALEELAAKAKKDQAELAAKHEAAKHEAAKHEAAKADPLGDILGGKPEEKKEPVKPITPQELIERIQHVNKSVAGVTPKIRELVTKFLDGKPGSAMTIPEEKRAAFLVELEALK